jgi:hypothetical protein
MPIGLPMNVMRRNDDAMKNNCRLQKKVRTVSLLSASNVMLFI